MTTVLSVFKSKPTRSKCLTSASKRFPASTRDRPKTKMSSAKRKSSKLGPPSIKLKPTCPTSALHSRIAHCKTEQNKRGLSTHPCRTPPVILNLLLCPMSPTTSPHCPKYTHCKVHTRWTGIPTSTSSTSISQNKIQLHPGSIHGPLANPAVVHIVGWRLSACNSQPVHQNPANQCSPSSIPQAGTPFSHNILCIRPLKTPNIGIEITPNHYPSARTVDII